MNHKTTPRMVMGGQPHPSAIVRAAIDNTPSEYYASVLRQRAGRGSGEPVGSFFPRMTPGQLHSFLLQMEWDAYDHEAVQEPARAFVARNVPNMGRVGLMRLSDVPEGATLRWADPKGTGKAEVVMTVPEAKLPKSDLIVVLVGPGDDGEPIVWTLHPGEPIRPSQVPSEAVHGNAVTKAAAARLGIEWVKLEVQG